MDCPPFSLFQGKRSVYCLHTRNEADTAEEGKAPGRDPEDGPKRGPRPGGTSFVKMVKKQERY